MIRSAVRYVLYPYFSKKDGHSHLFRDLHELEDSQFWPSSKIEEMQFMKMKNLLSYAYLNTAFYKRRFDACGFNPQTMQDFSDVKKIPILTKNDIIKNTDALIAYPYTKADLVYFITGGTTGPGVGLYADKTGFAYKAAVTMRFDKWPGWNVGEWTSVIWPAVVDFSHDITLKKKVRNYLSYRKIILQMVTVEQSDIEKHVKEIIDKKATAVKGFPSQTVDVAGYIIDKGIKLNSVKGVITTGEPLYSNQRELIERAFGCMVYDSYRTRDAGSIAQECEKHRGLHISAESVYVETVDTDLKNTEDDTSSDPGAGKILVTDLANYGMPLIRYENGDIGALSDSGCDCGRGLPLLKEIGGRLVDVIYTTEGKKIAPVTLIPGMFLYIGIMNQFRIIQESFTHLRIMIKKPEPDETLLRKQKEIIHDIFGAAMEVSYDFVDDIPPVQSGKFPFIISRIPKDLINRLE